MERGSAGGSGFGESDTIDENFVFTPTVGSRAHRLKQQVGWGGGVGGETYNFKHFVAVGSNTNWNTAGPQMAERGNSVQHDLQQLSYDPKLEPQPIPATPEGAKGQM